MIIKVEMFGCTCDNCGERWVDEHNGFAAFTDETSMNNMMGDDTEWYTDHQDKAENKHYCPKCWSFDDDDNLVLRKIEICKSCNGEVDPECACYNR